MNTIRALGIAVAVLAALAGGASQLTILFGQHVSDMIVAALTLMVGGLGAAIGVVSSQTNQIASVRAMDGVEKVLVNEKANPTLAKLAIDPDIDKVEVIPSAKQAVEETAKAA